MSDRDLAPGLSRRDLIKRSAVAAGAAWTAPMIIDSIARPAGALTIVPPPPGCWYTFFNGGSCNDTNQGTPCNNAPTSCSNGYAAQSRNLGECIVVTNDYCKGTASPVVLTNAYCENCKIVYAEAKTGSDCAYPASPPNTNGNIPAGTNTVTFAQNLDPSGYSQFALLLSCD